MYNNNQPKDERQENDERFESMLQKIQTRFKTYGYERIKTAAFEQYDFYAETMDQLHRSQMVKLVDPSGDVLVLRPDVTIPLIKQLAEHNPNLQNERKLYYIQDVFRREPRVAQLTEQTQAGVEYFCERSPEKDAEVIAVACHLLKDLGFSNIKIEVGHVGFLQSLLEQVDLTVDERIHLKDLIQSKNIADIAPYLQVRTDDDIFIDACTKIPLLYGDPLQVVARAEQVICTEKMRETVQYVLNVYEMLKLYGLEKNIVLDLSLMNRMGYYSDMVFQGYVESFGQPVLMGGRYNQLGKAFGGSLPAVGFACTVDSLLTAQRTVHSYNQPMIDVCILYAEDELQRAIERATLLRESNFSVVLVKRDDAHHMNRKVRYTVTIEQQLMTTVKDGKTYNMEQFLQVLENPCTEQEGT